MKNITEQISIIEKVREITPSILKTYIPEQQDSKLPALVGAKTEAKNVVNPESIIPLDDF